MEFIDLKAQQARIKDKLDARIQAVLAHGAYIMGPQVAEFEQRLGRRLLWAVDHEGGRIHRLEDCRFALM